MKTRVLVTGGDGQLANTFKSITPLFPTLELICYSSSQLDITDAEKLQGIFKSSDFSWCINCAAYTAVDQAETEAQKAYNINAEGAKIIAQNCRSHQINLCHFSTDFVFNGLQNTPYQESDKTDPLSVYGRSKLQGEKEIMNEMETYFIFRTSWLYSEFGHNFLKTILNLSKTKSELNVVNDQIGSPTYARDLAEFVLTLITNNSNQYGLYHYCNSGETSWYEFASTIVEYSQCRMAIHPIPTELYPTKARRPTYSVLDCTKAEKTFNMNVRNWRESLKRAMAEL